ncbi:MAG: sialic acid synthase SpsE [Candidatus Marinamargulisbacteria bacterium]|jgi:sialic acid synthase SpsE
MGSLEKAIEIMEGAKKGGADAIGIHITDLDNYMTRDYTCNVGQTLSDSADTSVSIFDFLDKINLTNDQWLDFGKKAAEVGIDIVSMCNDQNSFEFSQQLDIKHQVVSAACFNDFEFIRGIVRQNPNIVLRIGGATLDEIKAVVDLLLQANENAKINMLAGIQLYPTPLDQLHIGSIKTLKEAFPQDAVEFGLADHIDGDSPFALTLPALALPYGITMIEKHITTRREDKLEDYEAALGIEQFKDFVDFIRVSESGLGSGSIDYLTKSDSFQRYREVARKKVVASQDLKQGDILDLSKIAFKRADSGVPIEKVDLVVGKALVADLKKDQGVILEFLNS